MNIKNIFNNLVVFAAMYACLLLIVTLSFDFISPIIKAKKISSDGRISAQAFAGVKDQKTIFSNSRTAPKEYIPFVAWKQKPYASKYVNINADGYRQTPQQKSSTKKNNRWLFRVITYLGRWGERRSNFTRILCPRK